MANNSFSQITPHIARLDARLGGGSTVAVFLVKSDDGWSLVDTGPEKEADSVIQATLAFTKGEQPKRLILTHGHADHAGGAVKMRATFGCKVAAGRLEIPYLTEPVFYRKIPAHTPLYYLINILGQPAMVGKSIDLPLDEKMVIAGMTVYHVPGHAPGMIALLHKADRTLICADTFSLWGGALGDPVPLMTYDPKLNTQSQAKLALLDFDHLLRSHGPNLMNARQQVRSYVEKKLGKEKFARLQTAAAK
jgi:glyoxylase-like metal-dependent hydrolase (beta-lactamase superfamily II)